MNDHDGIGRRDFISLSAAASLAPGYAPNPGRAAKSGDVSVSDFGALGDGLADDTAAIQRAIDSLQGSGGVVRFGHGRYRIMRTLRVSSALPISLIGEMAGHLYDAPRGASALLIGAPMDYLIEYVAPAAADRSRHGSGTIQRLAFVDPTAPNNGSFGRHAVIAALHLRDFGMGVVDGCTFQWIRGGAIKTDFAVMTTVRGCRVRYCGDPERPERSAVLLGGTSLQFNTQSFVLDDTRIEACYSGRYVLLGPLCRDVVVRACVFEAATTEYPRTSQTFVETSAERFSIDGCVFNRNEATSVVMRGRGKMTGCHFINGPGRTVSVQLRGDRCILSSCIFEDNRSGLSIDCSGVQNTILGNAFYHSGGVRLSGRGNAFVANQISNPEMRTGAFLSLGDRCTADNNRFDGNGSPTTIQAIEANLADRVTNNSIDRWTRSAVLLRGAKTLFAGNTFNEVPEPSVVRIAAGDGSEPDRA